MKETSKLSRMKTSSATRKSISSPASAVSRSDCASPDSPKIAALSPEDSLARTSATLESAPALPDPVRGFGGKWCVAFAWYDRSSSLWKTWQRCLVEGWASFSETWPRSVMTRSGIAFRPQTLEPLTLEDESGLLPTMRAAEHGQYQYSKGDHNKKTLTLTGVVMLVPTPISTNWHNRETANQH